ncbi:MAG: hypothetical protein R3320_11105 [Nitriliruptorales bacterium]|nr:hypothetical protein [Nitriliruptorales bacterium]
MNIEPIITEAMAEAHADYDYYFGRHTIPRMFVAGLDAIEHEVRPDYPGVHDLGGGCVGCAAELIRERMELP